eukprot:g599.t1
MRENLRVNGWNGGSGSALSRGCKLAKYQICGQRVKVSHSGEFAGESIVVYGEDASVASKKQTSQGQYIPFIVSKIGKNVTFARYLRYHWAISTIKRAREDYLRPRLYNLEVVGIDSSKVKVVQPDLVGHFPKDGQLSPGLTALLAECNAYGCSAVTAPFRAFVAPAVSVWVAGDNVLRGTVTPPVDTGGNKILHYTLKKQAPGHVLAFPEFHQSTASGILDTTGWHGGTQDFTFVAVVTPTSRANSITVLGRAQSGVSAGFDLSIRNDGYLYLNLYDLPSSSGYAGAPGFLPSCVHDPSSYDVDQWGKELTSAVPLPLHESTHIAFVRRGKIFELYLNGTLSCTADVNVVWDDAMGVVSPDVLVLGARYTSTSPTANLFAGTIIDAMVYTSALPAPFLAAIALPSTILVPNPTGTAAGGSPHDDLSDCEDCGVLQFSPFEGHAEDCFLCLTARTLGSTSCDGCDPGTFKVKVRSADGNMTDECHACAAGFFSERQNSPSCDACPRGYHGNSQVSSDGTLRFDRCETCPRGRYGTANKATNQSLGCADCPAGRYSDLAGIASLDKCKVCPAGRWNAETGTSKSADCVPCTAGKFSETPSATSEIQCTTCAVGRFATDVGAATMDACVACPAGFAQADRGSIYCLPCTPGKFGPHNGTERCIVCPLNSFSDAPRSLACSPCGGGEYTLGNSSVACTTCSPGRFKAAGSAACQKCPIGFVSATPGSTLCDECHAGLFTAGNGSVSCTECLPGRFKAAGNGSLSCAKCPNGFMSASPGSTLCDECPAGQFTAGNGSVSCAKCLPGRFKAAGSAACHDCPIGFVSAIPGSTLCDECPAGQYTAGSDGGQAGCLRCLPGRYKTGQQMNTCRACPRGFMSETEGATTCQKCATASFTEDEGASACTPCDLGTFGIADGAACADCPAGFFQDEKKQLACKLCPTSRWSGARAATSLSECSHCPSDRTTGNVTGARRIQQCLCRREQYYEAEDDGDDSELGEEENGEDHEWQQEDTLSECRACPDGAVCPVDGSRLMHLHAQFHFWQPKNITSEFVDCASAFSDRKLAALAQTRCCPSQAGCSRVPRPHDWTPDDQCTTGYSGPLCVACADNYVLYGNDCILCDGGSPLWVGIAGLLGVALVLFVVMIVVLRHTTMSKTNTQETRMTRLSGLVSITISWLQILSAFSVTYKVAWPENFVAYSTGAGAVVNLEVFSLLSVTNCALAVP